MADLDRIEAPALSDHDLTPEECMALARSVAEQIELGALERGGEGSFELLCRDEHSEGWLNTWWEPRDGSSRTRDRRGVPPSRSD